MASGKGTHKRGTPKVGPKKKANPKHGGTPKVPPPKNPKKPKKR